MSHHTTCHAVATALFETSAASKPRLTIPSVVYADLGFANLITPDGYNPKTRKGRAKGYASYILHLAPSTMSGRNTCGAFATPECIQSCLNTAGHGGIRVEHQSVQEIASHGTDSGASNEIQAARIARTHCFFEHYALFMWLFETEVATAIRRSRANGWIPTIRPNGTSDLSWEHMRLNNGQTVFERWSDVQFYDYTKNPRRAVANASGQHAPNYMLTFSRSELNDVDTMRVLASGGNVAVVFDCAPHAQPATWRGYRVIDGDTDDLRFLDPAGVVVGLGAKGRAIGTGSADGFVVDPAAMHSLALYPERLLRAA
jgi:hypothetical protein